MQFDAHKNLSRGTILTAPTPSTSGEELVLVPGDGQFFEANMPCTLAPDGVLPTFDNAEIGYITDVDGDNITLLRAQEDSLPKTVQAGWVLLGTLTAKSLSDIEAAVADAGDKSFTMDFPVSTSVTVDHNLNKRPSVTVIDSAGDEVEVEVEHVNNNRCILTIAGGFSGSVFCN